METLRRCRRLGWLQGYQDAIEFFEESITASKTNKLAVDAAKHYVNEAADDLGEPRPYA